MQKFVVTSCESDQTLEKYVKKVLKDAPLSFIYKLFRKKDIKVNGHHQDRKFIVQTNDEVSIYITDEKVKEFSSVKEIKITEDISSWILFEDENILIINKPRGVLVQKDKSGDTALDDMVISYLVSKKEYDPNKEKGFVPAPVHRLDRNTAGIIIFGKNLRALQELGNVINDKEKVIKKYMTLVEGICENTGKIDLFLKKLSSGRVIVDNKEGKESHTQFKLIETFNNYSLLDVSLLTGRTHQIRVHLSEIGHPVIGDTKYGNYELNKQIEKQHHFKNQFLVAYYLKFNGLDGELKYLNNKEFCIKLPNECSELIDSLKM